MQKGQESKRILFIEDLPSDYELAKQVIKREGIGFESIRVETAEGMLSAISEFKPNIIISDYSMPQFDGLSALKLALTTCPDIPFIMLTGSMNEEVAVDCMKAGAADYVIKERIKRLPFAIKEALSHSTAKNEKEVAERALVASEERFRRLAENAQDIIYRYEYKPNPRFSYVSPSAETITGYTPKEHYNDPLLWQKIVHKDYRCLTDWLNYCKEDITRPTTIRLHRKDSTIAWTEHKNIPIYDSDNNLEAIEGIARDITEAKLIEESLATERMHMSILMENAPINIYFKDLKSRFIRNSRAHANMFGITDPSEMVGKTDFDFFSKRHAQEAFDDEQEIIRTEVPKIDIEEMETWPDGRVTWTLTSKMPLRLSDGTIVGTFGVSRDISERKKVEQLIFSKNKELLLAKEKAEQADRLKSAFLHNLSHEIRTPMNGIMGFTELLMNSRGSIEKSLTYLELIEKSGSRLMDIINDLVEISKIETGHVQLYSKFFNINETMQKLYATFEPEANERGLSFEIVLPKPSDNIQIYSDSDKFTRVLSNLLRNAFKFTNKGSIKFGYTLKDNEMEFYVSDTGIGIEPQLLNAIFERFHQVDISTSSGYEGAGLGLSISKAFVESMGGGIWAQSEPGKGSTFFFTMPIQSAGKDEPEEKSHGQESDDMFSKLNALVVEDDVVSRLLLGAMLTELKIDAIFARNGNEGVELVRESKAFDFILMDIKMPNMNGYEATKIIREMGYTKPIIAQTAYASEEDMQMGVDCGLDAYITKPVKSAVLRNTLIDLLKKGGE